MAGSRGSPAPPDRLSFLHVRQSRNSFPTATTTMTAAPSAAATTRVSIESHFPVSSPLASGASGSAACPPTWSAWYEQNGKSALTERLHRAPDFVLPWHCSTMHLRFLSLRGRWCCGFRYPPTVSRSTYSVDITVQGSGGAGGTGVGSSQGRGLMRRAPGQNRALIAPDRQQGLASSP